MADKSINALPVRTAPTAGDKMLMIGAAEEYQIDYDKLASAILDKLATKQYSELDTTAKTVLGALDELNGKTIFKYIKNISNANDAIPVGDTPVYYIVVGSTNNPFEGAKAHIFVIPNSHESQYYTQIAFAAFRDIFYIRTATNQNTYSEWKEFSDNATLFAGTPINSGDDLNDYTTPGIYYSQDSTITASLSNMPEFFESGFSLDVKYLGSSSNLIQIITYTSSNGVGSVIYTRRRSNSLWADWYKLSGTIISS